MPAAGNEGNDRSGARGQRTLDRMRGFHRAGEGDTCNTRIADETGADRLSRTWRELQNLAWHAGLMQ